MRRCKVHNVRFYRPEPEIITSMCLLKTKHLLALSRFDGSIEIWNVKHACFLERRIPSSSTNHSIEGLAWCQSKLFSVGLHGLLVEYNITKLQIENVSTVTGGAAYCLDVNTEENEIAIGTEQGYLNLFTLSEDGPIFSKFFDKQEGCIMCLSYDPSGQFIASGSVDAIRVWDVASGHAIHKMSTGRSEANKETVVWCISFMSDLTIISGDSRGKLTFWDGNVGSQIESYQSHRGDILSLCVSDDESELFCAGVDPIIAQYVRINVKDDKKRFVKSIQRVIHDHDVRALALHGNKLFSGGIDSYLACSYHPPKTLLKFPNLLQYPSVIIAKEARFVMLRYANSVEVWELGACQNDEADIGLLSLEKEPKKLLMLQKAVETDLNKEVNEGICCCALSDNGKYLFYSWNSGTNLFQLQYEEDATLRYLLVDNFECKSCYQSVFTPDNSQLILALPTKCLQIFTLKSELVVDKQNLDVSNDITDTITHLIVSPCSKFLAAADAQNNIVVYKRKNNTWCKYQVLPKYNSSIVALSIQATTYNMVVTYADNKLIEYDIRKRRLTEFSKFLSNNMPDKWIMRNYPIRTISFDPKNPDIIILHDDSSIIIIDKQKMSLEREAKVAKLDTSMDGKKQNVKQGIHYIVKYKHLVHLDWLNDEELVAVEVTPMNILEQLPPCLMQKKFGQK